jgi:uncharacterized membrane protein YcaP (DUF421 family)
VDAIFRTLAVYFFLLLLFRISGKRTLSEMTSFDLIVLLIISEAVQQALIDSDHSVTNALLIVTTLVGISILLSFVKRWSPKADLLLEGASLIIVEHGKPIKERLQKSRVGEEDILNAARETQGLERMEQIKYAVLEKNGRISIIPAEGQGS